MDALVLKIFYGLGAIAGLTACFLAVLVGIVLCFQMVWWSINQTDAWIRIAKVMKKAARLKKKWSSK